MENSGRLVFKPWERRLDKTECVESDADEELLINIPFTGDVKLKGLIVIGGEDDTHPDKVKDHDDEFNIDMMATHQVRLFKNRENMSFDDAGAKADQEFSLVRDTDGSVQYKTKVKENTLEFCQCNSSQVVTFSSVHHLTLHFPSNFGADNTKIYYIGLAGEFTQVGTLIWQILLKLAYSHIFPFPIPQPSIIVL